VLESQSFDRERLLAVMAAFAVPLCQFRSAEKSRTHKQREYTIWSRLKLHPCRKTKPEYNPTVIRSAIPLSLALTFCVVACNGRSSREVKPELKPEAKLIGKWEEVAPPKRRIPLQFELLVDGTVIENDKVLGKWQQLGTGSFKFMDTSRIKVELQPNWYFGVVIYEVIWQDQDHVSLRAGDKTIQLTRVKP
jgi:hypothetical protein